MTTITFPIEILLTEGLTAIKESLTRETKSLRSGYNHYTELHDIFDEIDDMLQDPLDYLQEINGCYIQDLEEEALEDLNNVEKGLLFLSQNKERWNDVNHLLKLMLPEITEYKVLREELSIQLDKH